MFEEYLKRKIWFNFSNTEITIYNYNIFDSDWKEETISYKLKKWFIFVALPCIHGTPVIWSLSKYDDCDRKLSCTLHFEFF